MKKRIKVGGFLGLVMLLLVASTVWAAPSSLTQNLRCYGKNGDVCALTLTWVGASAGGAFASTAITAAYVTTLAEHYPYILDTWPVVNPTAGYDITITTANGVDILNGAGADRTLAVQSVGVASTVGYHPVGGETLTLNIANTSVNSGSGVIRLWFVK